MFQGCKTWPLYDFEILQDRSATCTLRLCWQENGPCQACSNFNVCLMLAQPVCNSHIMPCHKDYWYLIVGVTKRHKAGCSDQTSHGMQIHSSLWAKKHSSSTFIVSLSADSTYVTSFCTNRFFQRMHCALHGTATCHGSSLQIHQNYSEASYFNMFCTAVPQYCLHTHIGSQPKRQRQTLLLSASIPRGFFPCLYQCVKAAVVPHTNSQWQIVNTCPHQLQMEALEQI